MATAFYGLNLSLFRIWENNRTWLTIRDFIDDFRLKAQGMQTKGSKANKSQTNNVLERCHGCLNNDIMCYQTGGYIHYKLFSQSKRLWHFSCRYEFFINNPSREMVPTALELFDKRFEKIETTIRPKHGHQRIFVHPTVATCIGTCVLTLRH